MGEFPEWYLWLSLAKEWPGKPWELEAEAPALWVDRWMALNDARAKKAEHDKRKAGSMPGVRKLI